MPDHAALLLAAGLLAGGMNALAGGGTFVTLPALVFAGIPAVVANASSTVALLPGSLASTFAARRNIVPIGAVAMPVMLAISLLGGAAGAALLLATPVAAFDRIVPWLLLVATLTFAFGRSAGEALRRRVRIGPGAVLATQAVLGVYGGYFGGAVGIMMMAVWTLLDGAGLHAMSPARTLLVSAANTAAAVMFVVAGGIAWSATLLVLAGGILGGYGGTLLRDRLPLAALRAIVIGITVAMTLAFFWRAYG